MTAVSVPDRFTPQNDPTHGPSLVGELFHDALSTDPGIVGPDELRGRTISEAEDAYVGVRRSEALNDDYSTGTKHSKAKRRYRQILDTDRLARAEFGEPAVGMQTFVFDPTQVDLTLGPVEQVRLTTEGATRGIRRTRDRLHGEKYVYAGVRDIDTDGLSHWHVYYCVDTTNTDGDSLDLYAGIESHIRHCDGATYNDHPSTEAVKWDETPNSTAQSYGADLEHGGAVHPCARYVAASLPHIGEVGEMAPSQVRHGAIEWATPSRAFKMKSGSL